MLEVLLNSISVNNSRFLIKREDEAQRISKIIDCPVEIVQHCMLQIGPSLPAIEAYWEMNKERLLKEVVHTPAHS